MKIAVSTDWKTKRLPAKQTTVLLDRSFNSEEMGKIKKGLIPQQMEDKWFIYYDSGKLFFHRSWTGFCLYVVSFVEDGQNGSMTKADINRNPIQYTETNDEKDIKMISFLIDILLLHHPAKFPTDEASSDKRLLMEWSFVGRAMLGKHPENT
jgi:hypothetical protein